MKIATAMNPVETQGIAQQNQFTIAITGKVFDDLFDKRYPDKPKAIIRELATNAKDASNGRPFEVRLPTKMMPRLLIKDDGTGMDHETVMGLYTTAFKSTKDTSNDQTGGFGIGSKSPFAYTDMFTVESRFDGLKRTYTCFRDQARIPNIALTTEEPTTEPNGITVEVPVEIGDITTWHDAAKKVLPYFDPMPKVNITVEPVNYVIRTSTWAMRKRAEDYYARQRDHARLIMGCIPYPIDVEKIDTQGLARELLRMPIDLFMPIGTVEILTNREGLEYDREGKTAKAIKAAIGQVANELPKLYEKDIGACKTLWEARLKFKQLVIGVGWEYNTVEKLRRSLLFNDRELHFQQTLKSKPDAELCHLGHREKNRAKLSLAPKGEAYIEVKDDLVILLDDLTVDRPVVRVKYALENNKFPNELLVIRGTNPQPILDQLGDPPTIRMQDLDDPPAAVRQVYKSDVQPVTKWDGGAFYDHSYDVTTGGYYVAIDHGNAKRGDAVVGNSFLQEIWSKTIDLGLAIHDIYGIPMTHKRVPQKNPGWTNYFDHVEAEVKRLIAERDLGKMRANRMAMDAFRQDWADSIVRLLVEHNLRPTKVRSKMAKLIDGYLAVRATLPDHKFYCALDFLANRLGIEVKEPKPEADLPKLTEEVAIRYALLNRVHSCISANGDSECAADIMEFINLKD